MESMWTSLREWNRVLVWLEYSVHQRTLDSHEKDLLWLLRFDGNWRLREAALKALQHLSQPSVSLMKEVMRIVEDDSLYSEVRVLAAQALAHLLNCGGEAGRPQDHPQMIMRQLRAMIAEPQPPIVADAVRGVLEAVEALPASVSQVAIVQRPSKRRKVSLVKDRVHEPSP